MSLVDDAFDIDPFIIADLPFAAYYSVAPAVAGPPHRPSDDPRYTQLLREWNYGPLGYEDTSPRRPALLLKALFRGILDARASLEVPVSMFGEVETGVLRSAGALVTDLSVVGEALLAAQFMADLSAFSTLSAQAFTGSAISQAELDVLREALLAIGCRVVAYGEGHLDAALSIAASRYRTTLSSRSAVFLPTVGFHGEPSSVTLVASGRLKVRRGVDPDVLAIIMGLDPVEQALLDL